MAHSDWFLFHETLLQTFLPDHSVYYGKLDLLLNLSGGLIKELNIEHYRLPSAKIVLNKCSVTLYVVSNLFRNT